LKRPARAIFIVAVIGLAATWTGVALAQTSTTAKQTSTTAKPASNGVADQFKSGADRVGEGATQIGEGIKQGAIMTWDAIKAGANAVADKFGNDRNSPSSKKRPAATTQQSR
jgi:hypothetical protein